MQQIYSTDGAFAALVEDGSVVAWGDALSGGDVNASRQPCTGLGLHEERICHTCLVQLPYS